MYREIAINFFFLVYFKKKYIIFIGDFMLVYRICNNKELDIILKERNFSNIGSVRKRERVEIANTHKYIVGIRYMHFFWNMESVYRINKSVNYAVCTYDIPEELLNKYYGAGRYLINKDDFGWITEYAIPSEMIEFDYLKDILLISEICDNDVKFERIYSKKKIKKI